MNIELTWNLFATPVFIMLMGIIFKWYLSQRFDEMNESAIKRYKELKDQMKDAAKERQDQLGEKVNTDICKANHRLVDTIVADIRCDIKEIKDTLKEIFKAVRGGV